MAKAKRRKYNKKNIWKRQFLSAERTFFNQIYKGFIRPIIRAVVNHQNNKVDSPVAALDIIFCKEDRTVLFGIAKRGFILPGQIKSPDTNQLYKPSIQVRSIERGEEICVRFTDLFESVVEVETDKAVLMMTASEWEKISNYFRLIG